MVLEPLTPAHVDGLVAAAGESRRTYDFTWVPDDRPAMASYVAAALADQARGWALPFAVTSGGRVVGSTRFLDLDYWVPGHRGPMHPPELPAPGPDAVPSVAEIGATWLAQSAQRTGVNTEAKLLLLTHAFDRWEVHRVSFKTDARNERSRAALRGIGAAFEGVRRAHVPASDGTVRDSAYFSIVRAEWPAVRRRLEARLAASSTG